MITFNDIYEASRKERYSEKLNSLPQNFISEVAEYLGEKRKASMAGDEFSEATIKTKKQLESATTHFKELMNWRKKKILNLILIATETGTSKKDFDNMFDFEKNLFDSLMKCVEISDKQLNQELNSSNGNSENQKVEFKEDVGEFVGLEGEKIGGFKKGEIVELPKQIAHILIEGGKAISL